MCSWSLPRKLKRLAAGQGFCLAQVSLLPRTGRFAWNRRSQVLSDAAADRVVSAASTALAAVAGRLDSVQQDADAVLRSAGSSGGLAHAAGAAKGAAAGCKDLAAAAGRLLLGLRAARNRAGLGQLRAAAGGDSPRPQEAAECRRRWRSRTANGTAGAVGLLRRRVLAASRIVGPPAATGSRNPAHPGPRRRGRASDTPAPGHPGPEPANRPAPPSSSEAVRPTPVRGRPGSAQLAEALVRREADDAAEAEAIEAKAAQVAALVEMVARETADQAEMVTVIGDLAKETEEHSDAANAHLLVAAGTGPLFGRSIMIFLLALSGVLLMLHWLNP